MNRKQALKQIAEAAKVIFGEETLDSDRDKLKRKINYETIIGSCSESGGHIHGGMAPMNDYDTQSVINTLRNFDSFDLDTSEADTEKENYYTEKWKS